MGCFVLGHLSYRMFCQYDDLSVHLYSKIGAYGYSMEQRPELALSIDVSSFITKLYSKIPH